MKPILFSAGDSMVITWPHADGCQIDTKNWFGFRRKCSCGVPKTITTEDPEIIRHYARMVFQEEEIL